MVINATGFSKWRAKMIESRKRVATLCKTFEKPDANGWSSWWRWCPRLSISYFQSPSCAFGAKIPVFTFSCCCPVALSRRIAEVKGSSKASVQKCINMHYSEGTLGAGIGICSPLVNLYIARLHWTRHLDISTQHQPYVQVQQPCSGHHQALLPEEGMLTRLMSKFGVINHNDIMSPNYVSFGLDTSCW